MAVAVTGPTHHAAVEDPVDHGLDGVDEEEAEADDELGEGIVRVCGHVPGRARHLQALPDLRDHVDEDGGEKDAAAHAQHAADKLVEDLGLAGLDQLLEWNRRYTTAQLYEPNEKEHQDL